MARVEKMSYSISINSSKLITSVFDNNSLRLKSNGIIALVEKTVDANGSTIGYVANVGNLKSAGACNSKLLTHMATANF